MNIKEAEYILNEAVIDYPSVRSYNYISAEEINTAIEKILEELSIERIHIKQLEKEIIEEKTKFEEIIRKKEIEALENKKSKISYIDKLIKYLKKVVKPVFLLEN